MTPARRSRLIPALLLALVCAGMVVSFYLGHLNTQWVLWLAAFLVMELTAVIHRTPGATFSERVWAWAGIRPQRASRWIRIPTVPFFGLELVVHLSTGGSHWWSGGLAIATTSAPLAFVIAWSLWEQRKEPSHA